MKLALFDLDHTLLPIDSDHSWGKFSCQVGLADAAEVEKKNNEFYQQYLNSSLNMAEYVKFSTAAIRRAGPAESARAYAQYMKEIIAPAITPEAKNLVQKHKNAGETVIIITATNEFIGNPIAYALGADDVISTKLKKSESGWYTGEIDGTPSFQAGKVERIKQWLAQKNQSLEAVQSTFYSDSINDLPLLEKVNTPIATNPDAKLEKIAKERGWQILELFKKTL